MNWVSPNLPPPHGTPIYLRINPESPTAPYSIREGFRRKDHWEDLTGAEIAQATVYAWGRREN